MHVLRSSAIYRAWNGIQYRAGPFAKNVGHEVYNLNDSELLVAVVARSDASEWEHIVDYPSNHRPVQ